MGTPAQEEFAVFLKTEGIVANIFTCGGFISQTAIRTYYYHKFGKGKLRWLQRAIEFKHIRKRLLFDYPINIIRYIFDHVILTFYSIRNKQL
jgi:N-acetylglucosaminyldiphosphoundecaprenol N-acetyl-beta-D-mannosaminyltransferase